MDTAHLRQAHQHLVAISTQLDTVREALQRAVDAPPGAAHQHALQYALPLVRELRHHAMALAASIGAAEAVR